jgi:hypothetical protein
MAAAVGQTRFTGIAAEQDVEVGKPIQIGCEHRLEQGLESIHAQGVYENAILFLCAHVVKPTHNRRPETRPIGVIGPHRVHGPRRCTRKDVDHGCEDAREHTERGLQYRPEDRRR